MNAPRSWPSQSLFSAGPECKCLRSRQGRLFANLLDVRDRCGHCGLDLTPHGTGDGATVFFHPFPKSDCRRTGDLARIGRRTGGLGSPCGRASGHRRRLYGDATSRQAYLVRDALKKRAAKIRDRQ